MPQYSELPQFEIDQIVCLSEKALSMLGGAITGSLRCDRCYKVVKVSKKGCIPTIQVAELIDQGVWRTVRDPHDDCPADFTVDFFSIYRQVA